MPIDLFKATDLSYDTYHGNSHTNGTFEAILMFVGLE